MRLHATAIAINGQGVLLTGAAQSGKTSLAIELMQQGAKLIGDDRLTLFSMNGQLYARSVTPDTPLIELAGVGIVQVPAAQVATSAPIRFEVRLQEVPPPRYPDVLEEARYEEIVITRIYQQGRDASVAAKIMLLMRCFQQERRIARVTIAKPRSAI